MPILEYFNKIKKKYKKNVKRFGDYEWINLPVSPILVYPLCSFLEI